MRRHRRFFLGEGPVMLWMLAGCLVGVIGLSLMFRRVIAERPGTVSGRPRVQWLAGTNAAPSQQTGWRYAVADLLDPSLLSLPSAHGFSHHAWERDVVATRRALDWPSDPAFLSPPATPAFRSMLEPSPLPELVQRAVEKSPAESTEEPGESAEPVLTLNTSVLRIEGALATWPVLHAPELGVVTSDAPLRPTRVRIGTTSDGVVRYALIHRTSGNEPVDTEALEWARQIRFEPRTEAGNGTVSWGIVSFFWLTKPAAAGLGAKS